MDNEKKKNIFSRRSFLKGLGIGTAAVAVPTIVGCAKDGEQVGEQEPPIGKMTYRISPSTGDKVSLLGYGMMRLPTKNDHIGERQNGEGEIDQDMVNKQVDYALKHGLNLFDTSPLYCEGLSEKALGTALSRHDRKQYFISTKMSNYHDYSRESSIAMFEKSLKELQTTYFDYYLWHNIGGDRAEEGLDAMGLFEERFVNNGMMDFLNQKKEEGVIRNLGFSYHGDGASARFQAEKSGRKQIGLMVHLGVFERTRLPCRSISMQIPFVSSKYISSGSGEFSPGRTESVRKSSHSISC